MKQSRLTGAISLSMAQAVVLLLGYVAHIWIGRVLGPAAYGIYGVVLSVQTIIGLVITLGIPAAVSRFVARSDHHAQSILSQSLRIQAVIALIVAGATLLIAPLIARLLRDTSLTSYLWVVGAIVFFQAFYPIFVQFLSGMHRFHRQAGLTTVYAVAKLAGAIALIYTFGVFGAFAGFAIGGIVAAIVGYIWTRKIGGREVIVIPLKEFLSFAGSYVLLLVGLQLLISLDLFMVKSILRDDIAAGYYNAAVTLSRIPYFLLQGLSFILLPSVSALTKPGSSHDAAATFIRDVLRYLIALIVPSITLAAATSKELVALFFSHTFAAAAPLLTVLMIGLGVLAFYLLLVNIAAGAGKTKVTLGITGLMIVISASIGAFTIPAYGLIGAAWQTTIASLIGFTLLATYTFRTFSIKVPIRTLVNVVIATIAITLPTYVWKVSAYMLPAQYLILLSVYGVILLALQELTAVDKQRLASIHPAIGKVMKYVSR